jgi:copper resistance protein B
LRAALLALLLLAPGAALAQAHAGHPDAARGDHAHDPLFTVVRGEVDRGLGEDLTTWEGELWRGGDVHKLRLTTEGEIHDGVTEHAEVQVLYSRAISTFFDAQAGVRHDFEQGGRSYLTVGVRGLAPYSFDTEAEAFLSEDGDLSFRFEQGLHLLFTQRLIAEPHVELNVSAEDDERRDLGGGVTDAQVGVQVRYEITRKFAPYLDLEYERKLGETALRARAAGEEAGRSVLKAGLRFWF